MSDTQLEYDNIFDSIMANKDKDERMEVYSSIRSSLRDVGVNITGKQFARLCAEGEHRADKGLVVPKGWESEYQHKNWCNVMHPSAECKCDCKGSEE